MESSGDYDIISTEAGNFNGTVQDLGVYSRALTQTEVSMLAMGLGSLSGAEFLPQCICMPDYQASITDTSLCDSNNMTRYVSCTVLVLS